MTALHTAAASDILAATGQAGMQGAESGRFWNWRRIVLTIGYGLLFAAGLIDFISLDPTGLALMAAAVAGVLFLHRTALGIAIWAYVAVVGAVAMLRGQDLGLYGVLAGLSFGVFAVPIWSTRRPARSLAAWQPQSPFVAPVALPTATPTATPPPPPAVSADAASSLESAPAATLTVRTIGRIQLVSAAGDLAPRLLSRPVIGFLFIYLLARSVRSAGDRLLRTAIANEVAYGVSDQRGRVRGYLRDLTRLPQPLGSMVKIDDELVGLDLAGCDVDFDRMRRLAARMRQTDGHLDDELMTAARRLIDELGEGEFLPAFEEMEKRATQGRGEAGDIVRDLRVQIDNIRADIAESLARALVYRGQAAQAVALLDPVNLRSQEREDVARTLIKALRESGQHARAEELSRRYDFRREN